MDFQLGLRQGRYRVSLIGINSRYEPPFQFALCYPNSRNPYADIITSWGGQPDSLRQQAKNTIDIPLDRRTQTFLSHQVSPQLAEQLRGFQRAGNDGRNGSTRHQIEINTHKSNHVTVRERPTHIPKMVLDNRAKMRESIVTTFHASDPVERRTNSSRHR